MIEDNQIYSNSDEGVYIEDGGSSSDYVLLENNTIRDHLTKAGVNIGGASYISIGGSLGTSNTIHDNYAGIGFNSGLLGSGDVDILSNQIYRNDLGGIGIDDENSGAILIDGNDIFQNTQGGIGIRNTCNLTISNNDIFINGRGGIHTGTDLEGGEVFNDVPGLLTVQIFKNKVRNNGGSGYGGGIDVRHASGSIYNNLVYENHRGGIRFGEFITEIINNTSVDNGSSLFGGGIIYDDLAGAVNAPPDSSLKDADSFPAPVIRNNICAFDERAGIRLGYMPGGTDIYECPDNTALYFGNRYRDFNLLYLNNQTTYDCKWGETYPDKRCVNRNYGGCGFIDATSWTVINPNDIMADPLFKDRPNDNYRLQKTSEGDPATSPGVGSGLGGVDMGAYGGPDALDW
jgi:hypothetical protein